ncbi:hypothetical protein E3P98_03010 [Wallemia ichthyophaga]|nr:hypothetical protein E3P98_03010 [Wallemia ichthyophaga]
MEVNKNYLRVDTNILLELIGFMLSRLVQHNDQLPLDRNKLTRFHSRGAPGISINDYLSRIHKYTNTDLKPCCLLILLIYIDRISVILPELTITSLTVHRFIITAITVSSKALCDVFCTASHYSKVGGISLNELNLLEREFLRIIDWNLTCDNKQLEEYYLNLVNSHPNYTLGGGDGDEDIHTPKDDAITLYACSPTHSKPQIIPQSRPNHQDITESPQQRRRLS